MKKNLLSYMVMALAMVAILSLGACSSDPPSGNGPDSERLSALESQVKALRADAQSREARFKDELTQIRKNLEGIRGLIQVEKGRAEALDSPQPDSGDALDQEIDKKAKSFVSENLDRLLDITKKLLDKMEQELDKTAPKPKGEEI